MLLPLTQIIFHQATLVGIFEDFMKATKIGEKTTSTLKLIFFQATLSLFRHMKLTIYISTSTSTRRDKLGKLYSETKACRQNWLATLCMSGRRMCITYKLPMFEQRIDTSSTSHSTGKCNKVHCIRKVWEIDTNIFSLVSKLFSHRFPSYGTLHHMRNAWDSPSISHSTGKCNETHCIGWTWEIGTHTFPIVWVIFPYNIPILWYTSSYDKCTGFPINFLYYTKMQQNPLYGENQKNWFSSYSYTWVLFTH